MLNLDQLNSIITEAGPLEEEIQAVARTADDQWVIVFDGTQVDLECDAERERLMFSAVIGQVPAEQNDMLANMMAYALLWRETQGLRIGLTPGGRNAVLMVDLVGSELTPQLIARVATNVAERSLVWLSMVQADAISIASVDSSSEEPTPAHFIKL